MYITHVKYNKTNNDVCLTQYIA